jgi:nitroreductase
MQNQFLDAMNFRHACKEFDNTKKISDDDFNMILESGRLSPSSFGYEPWKFLVIQNKELRNKLKEFTWGAQGTLPTASHYVIILARKKSMIYGSSHVNHIMNDIKKLPQEMVDRYKTVYKKFQEDDFDLLNDKRALFDWACKQTYIAMANMMTGASFIGIDSCPIEGFQRTSMDEFIQNELDIDTNDYGVSVMVAFGYRKNEQLPKARQNLEDIVSWYN